MPPKKKQPKQESEDEVYERFLKKLLKDPRFKQLKPVVIKALSARGMGGGGRGGRGGRVSGMLQTPNQDNFTKIHSAILDTNAKLADLSNQMKRGNFDAYSYMFGVQQGQQGNSQGSNNIPPPKNEQLSMNEYARSLSRETVDLDNLSEKSFRRIGNEYAHSLSRDTIDLDNLSESSFRRSEEAEETDFHDFEESEAEQGHIPRLLNIPPPKMTSEMPTQTETRMYDTSDMLSVMSHGSIAARLKSHGIDTRGLPAGVDTLRESTSQLYKDEFKKQIQGVPGAIDLNLLQSGQRGRPRLHDPIIEEVETGEND